jgi:N,N'-diacetyllegionaminate synthase
VSRVDLPAGTVLVREHLAIKKPGTGLAPERLEEIVGRRLARAVAVDQVLAAEDIEGLPRS